ncbi:CAAX amino terminal protease self- immunity [Corynebacterium ciconiae DSM 44920]|uniref:CPBP family intramembrane glutamic endopeptidase n=1 Tax=Corynebacterium ciconiae TaxID=227319 RepID=UPI000369DCDB|nr:CPBP family intramembrane glutamic endopeptidase [Corynebacterium ciconiae]WKD60222.1 CAAX amino terminal protease self- immunity [Corynebacterium ciconiae DSM 44920]
MILAEIIVVLLITFGTSGLRSSLRLIDALLAPEALNEQSTTLNAPQSSALWLDLGLQLISAAALCGWGLLVVYLLARDRILLPRPRLRDGLIGAGLAAIIGVPGLGLYLVALHAGWSKEVVVSAYHSGLWAGVILLLWSFANAFAEETVVVWWLSTRLAQLRWAPVAIIAASAVLRGSYHLYQGVSAGAGNIVMGIVFAAVYLKIRRVWPLVFAHFFIDAVAFLGYQFLDVSRLGLS